MEAKREQSILQYAMNYGGILGLFWAFKYFFKAGETMWSPMIYIYYLLNAGTFLLTYVFYFKYRDSIKGQMQSRLKCIIFIILVCLFASVIESAAIYAHIQFIEPSYYYSNIEPILRAVSEIVSVQNASVASILISKGAYIAQVFLSNLISGIILAIMLSFMIGNRPLIRN